MVLSVADQFYEDLNSLIYVKICQKDVSKDLPDRPDRKVFTSLSPGEEQRALRLARLRTLPTMLLLFSL